ncbi:DNA adenine methylase [Helicobacter bilis]|uniref:S-adenosyl-L-methionine-dependent methyltransferase n=2 Tax=Helicobacter bilis TaxID=37372 RepID=A0A4U8U450_9HELI|nr:DNA adenine methylase [Helicobacter bilis]MDY4399614.1 DNA adenine methylase [Helicobacter bilis]TLE07307.1 s-adenosyl-L-methionine-dependent methyltransferase [Helicobacter bilis]TLE08358.1 s-adenosyl-L-methionine-dependent methyltransferase [Helicobacter bilis]
MQYNKPPLAFMGNKKNMLKHIKQVLQDMQGDGYINDETIFLDVFGGSGLISHNIKQWYPKNRVIWNDYDNYQKRLDGISDTEILRAKIYEVFGINDSKEKFTQAQKQEIQDFLKNTNNKS